MCMRKDTIGKVDQEVLRTLVEGCVVYTTLGHLHPGLKILQLFNRQIVAKAIILILFFIEIH